jgi:anaerobic ribonucleoside-triphosphate reductase
MNTNIKTNIDADLPAAERQKCEVWTRVMGYHRPVSSYNVGKKSEHAERKHFREDKIQKP